jgi:hypothetical protein
MSMFDTTKGLQYLFSYLLKKEKIDTSITINDAEKYNYIEKNIDVILKIFFNSKNNFTYNGVAYSIHSIDWNGNYQKIKNIDGSYTFYIDADLYVFTQNKDNSRSQTTGNTCEVKRQRILNDLKDIGLLKDKYSVMPYLTIPNDKKNDLSKKQKEKELFKQKIKQRRDKLISQLAKELEGRKTALAKKTRKVNFKGGHKFRKTLKSHTKNSYNSTRH